LILFFAIGCGQLREGLSLQRDWMKAATALTIEASL
jgi:hypothetical protein